MGRKRFKKVWLEENVLDDLQRWKKDMGDITMSDLIAEMMNGVTQKRRRNNGDSEYIKRNW